MLQGEKAVGRILCKNLLFIFGPRHQSCLTCTGVKLTVGAPLRSLATLAQTVPSFLRTMEFQSAAAIAEIFVSSLICTGVLLFIVVPSPSWPSLLLPHAHTVPSFLRATVCTPAVAIAETPVSPLICTGVFLFINVPSPSWPSLLVPHAHTVPSFLSAMLCAPPAAR